MISHRQARSAVRTFDDHFAPDTPDASDWDSEALTLSQCAGCGMWTEEELIDGRCQTCLHADNDCAWLDALQDCLDDFAQAQHEPVHSGLDELDVAALIAIEDNAIRRRYAARNG